ncbi:lysophospholipase [Planococcus sp. CP5-4]|uniref:alpha/beta fold hydrolase n=1 Tax=unclassified Planococcus (in: firmicutes) TaxID=2662419 RepID=UPI001C216BEC|nr:MULTISPECIES: alpha/beta fold hydrolase [unclassified Planococcus (in: firmicutes)]MBU9672033.1 lysophospholipase [Planococcus sp. CP5-4_YE]MBV0907596.1 lysophospholipase [Planococcus sp. CP5-4_UN]MBW6062763.1 lysophospholipase [Planococcus sp. CP5-4]
MDMTNSYIRVSDGQEIYCSLYRTDNPKGHVHIIHGMAEHSGRYKEFIGSLNQQGFTVSAHDQRGHGKTAERNGVRGYFAESDGFSRVVEDVQEVIRHTQQEIGKLPFILMGHSMGSFVARRYLQLHGQNVDCAVLSGTGGHPGFSLSAGIAAAKSFSKLEGKTASNPVLGNLIFGSYNKDFLDEKSKFSWLSSKRQAVEQFEADPWCGFEMANQFYVDLFEGLDIIHRMEEVERIPKSLPVLFISGTMDPVGRKGSGVFEVAAQFNKAGIDKVKVYMAEDGRHEVIHEVKANTYQQTILDWMNDYG